MKVRYTPRHATGTYDLDLTEAQWTVLKDNPDYQLMSAADIAAEKAQVAQPQVAAQAIESAIATLQQAEATVEATPNPPDAAPAGTAAATG